ncbi:RecT family recombinase [Methanofollis ethanolicus]|uniref:RecT family recombinase n=1 Tax=Methanofollis ethanolicus TaxID=488124 RepID=UPI0008304FFC|nr:RecT family recombinase [Methanofollis ethanolicus]
MTTDIAVAGEYSPHQREILLETVAKGCSPEQFMLMLELAKRYKLDPFARQIWATPAGIFVGRDGFLMLAHRSGDFDGMETTFEERNGKLFSATCTVWHKKMNHPFRVTVRLEEFFRPTPPGKKPGAWEKMPYVMLQKCAESHALRRAFCITGLYDEAEFEPTEYEPTTTTATINGEPAEVMRPPGKCSRCGKHDPMVPAYREKYQAAFEQAGLTLPGGICDECANELWRQDHGKGS